MSFFFFPVDLTFPAKNYVTTLVRKDGCPHNSAKDDLNGICEELNNDGLGHNKHGDKSEINVQILLG